MKKYKEELDQFQLSKEHKRQVMSAVYASQERKRTKRLPVFRYATAFVMIGIVFTVILLSHRPSETKPIAVQIPKEKLLLKEYTPQFYESKTGGLGGLTGTGNEQIYLGSLAETTLTTIAIDRLPVVEYKAVTTLKQPSISIDTTAYRSFMKSIAKQFKITSDLQTKKAYSSIDYVIEDRDYKLYNDAEASAVVSIKDPIEDKDYATSEKILKLAQQYTVKYQKQLKLTNPTYHVVKKDFTTVVLITDNNIDASIKQEASHYLTFEMQTDYVTIDHDVEMVCYPSFVFPYEGNRIQLGEYPILTQEEAIQVLEHQGYYTNNQTYKVTKEDIQSTDMVYVDGCSTSTFAPYRIPVYRFLILKEKELCTYDVVAIRPEALRKLDKVVWYMDK